jgi:NADH:ubiquinone oxidoreductase subunit F (NADH-binding)
VSPRTIETTRSRPLPPPRESRLLYAIREDGRAVSLSEHVGTYGSLRDSAHREAFVAELAASGLTGRGGAAFPTAAKLRAVAAGRRRPVVVVNGAESEPASGKDRALLRTLPHLVLDGAVLTAEALDAKHVIAAVSVGTPAECAALAAAVAERARARVDRKVSLRVVRIPRGFVAGEETALVRFLNGGPAKPTFTPPRPFERGVGGAPTLVQNVETLGHAALISRFGADWFREVGTKAEPGSALVTLSGAVRRPGVHEAELGASFDKLIDEAGGLTRPVSGFLVGGYFGTWVSAETLPRTRLLDADLGLHGASLGTRAIVAFPADTCAVGELARVARYLAGESAGQCGPCVHGLAAIAEGMERVASGRADDREQLARWVDVVRGRGACKHPDGVTRFAATGLDVFAEEVTLHLRHGRCSARPRAVLPIPREVRAP